MVRSRRFDEDGVRPGRGKVAVGHYLGHGFPIQKPGDKAKALFHYRTRFPRHPHLPQNKSGKCNPCVRYVLSPMSRAAQRLWPRPQFFCLTSRIYRIIDRPERWPIHSMKSCSYAYLRFWRGPRRLPTSPVSAKRSSSCCASSVPIAMALPRMIIWAISSPPSTPGAFQRCFVAWVSALTKTPAEVIAIDGKTLRRSYQKKGSKEPMHMVSAFAARQRLVMGQVAVAEKSNEIVAIPALLDMMAIEGAVVTIDAMGCQRTIAKKIIDKKADFILALKGNQGALHEDVKVFVAEQKAKDFKDTTVSRHETVDGDHGRIETRRYTVIHDVGWLQERHDWPGLQGVVMVESTREIGGKMDQETRFYITSLALLALAIAP